MYKKYVKRSIDIILSFVGIMVLFIPMLIIAIMIKIDSKGPVLFKQKRVGLHKKE
ncbi:MAG: sugar transferase, partial [Ruminococcaceae bacterium]|nr:sugar transferase [Oscillospiraceae bacterium]